MVAGRPGENYALFVRRVAREVWTGEDNFVGSLFWHTDGPRDSPEELGIMDRPT